MPLLTFDCHTHGPYEVLTTVVHVLTCPKCGEAGKQVFEPGNTLIQGFEFERNPAMRSLGRKHRVAMEKNMAEGKYDTVTERGPLEFRPHYEARLK
jgi:hypothetical protein